LSRDRIRKLKPIVFPTLDGRAVGRRIARARRELKWRQTDLARFVGVKRLTVANWECGIRIPPRRNLLKLSVALRRSIDWLLLGRRGWYRERPIGLAGAGGGRDSKPRSTGL